MLDIDNDDMYQLESTLVSKNQESLQGTKSGLCVGLLTVVACYARWVWGFHCDE